MQVVDVHVKSLRPQYLNLRDWCAHPDHVYIGRGQIVFIDGVRYPPKSSKWCNPFTTKKYGDRCIDLFEKHLDGMLEDEDTRREFLELRGKVLGCWCAPNRCHGDVIVRKLRTMEEKEE